MNLLKELKWERGISMLFITHDLALASDLCDRIVVVYAGQLREDGPADDVLVAARDPYTQGLLASISRLRRDAAPTFLPGAPPDLRRPPSRLSVRCPLPAGVRTLCRATAVGRGGAGHQSRAAGSEVRADDRWTGSPPDRGSDSLRVEHVSGHVPGAPRVLRLGARCTVSDVILQLPRGETLAVVGESGSGKTTLGRATFGWCH